MVTTLGGLVVMVRRSVAMRSGMTLNRQLRGKLRRPSSE
jgi:hypothetical protein